MKIRAFYSLLAIAVLVLLSLFGGSLYWILAQSPLALLQGGVMTQPQGAVFVPKQAPVMVSLLVNPDRLEAFAQVTASPANRRRSHQALQQVESSLLAATGLDYRREIQPWLGNEMTLAVTSLDFDHNEKNGTQPGYLLAVSTKDAQLAKEFLQLSYSQEAIAGNYDLVFEPYKGVNLIAARPLKPKRNTRFLASAVVSNFVLFANDIRVLREAINAVQVPNLTLNSADVYQSALKTITDPRIGIVYANFPALSAWLSNLPIPELPEITQTLTVTFSLKSQGLVAQTALIGVTGEANQSPALESPVAALDYLPDNSILAIAGTDLHHFWQEIQTGLDPESPLQLVANKGINLLNQRLGLNLPEEVFDWVQGEFSLALVPNPDGGNPDWLFVAEKTPDREFTPILEHFDQLAQEGGYSVGELPLLDTTVTAWTKLQTATEKTKQLARLDAQVKGVYAQTDRYLFLATSIEALSQGIAPKKTSLIESKRFQKAITALPTANDGYIYVDWNQSEPILTKNLPLVRVAELAVKPFFNHLRSLTLSSQGSDNRVRRATIFFNLGVR